MPKVAIMSDSHDNIWHLADALTAANAAAADVLLFCGDFCAPFVLQQMADAFQGPIHAVLGNNDADGRLLQTIASQYDHVHLHGVYVEVEVGTRQLGMIHYPQPAQRIVASGALDLVCYGHDHLKHVSQVNQSYLVNPGEIMGRLGPATWALYDCQAHEVTLHSLSN